MGVGEVWQGWGDVKLGGMDRLQEWEGKIASGCTGALRGGGRLGSSVEAGEAEAWE